MNSCIACNGDNIPRLYTNVTQFVYFVEWAAICHFEETRLYPLGKYKESDNWAKEQFCGLEERISELKEVYPYVFVSVHLTDNFQQFVVSGMNQSVKTNLILL